MHRWWSIFSKLFCHIQKWLSAPRNILLGYAQYPYKACGDFIRAGSSGKQLLTGQSYIQPSMCIVFYRPSFVNIMNRLPDRVLACWLAEGHLSSCIQSLLGWFSACCFAILQAISMQVDLIYIPHDFAMDEMVCYKSPIQKNTMIQDPGRSYPPSLVMDFRRISKCMRVRLSIACLFSSNAGFGRDFRIVIAHGDPAAKYS